MAFKIDDWENFSYSRKLSYQESLPVDCSFAIGEGVNTRTVGAHKSILARASTVFDSMFSGNYKEIDASLNIPMPNVLEYLDFKVILEYIYYQKTDSIEFLSLERLKHVSYLADYFMLDKLLNACHFKIERKVAESHTSFYDFIQIFEYEKKLGRMIGLFMFNGASYDYKSIEEHFPYTSVELLTNTSIYDLEPLFFYDLLKVLANKFKQVERFCLIENYAKIHGLKMEDFCFEYIHKTDNSKDDVHSESHIPGKTLKEMFELINFKKMTASEFKNGPAVSKIWKKSPEEKLQILGAIK